MSTVKYPESGAAIKSARSQARPFVSQERLADALGITRRHMIRLENGEHRPSVDIRDKIANVLGVDPETLSTEVAEDIAPFRDAA